MTVTVRFIWIPRGKVDLDEAGRPSFPRLERKKPGVYHLRLETSSTTSVYIGEAVDVARRMGNYRAPGPTQWTSRRVHQLIVDCLTLGGDVYLSTALVRDIVIDGQERVPDLGRKRTRLLVEGAALHAVPEAESIENLPGIGDRPD